MNQLGQIQSCLISYVVGGFDGSGELVCVQVSVKATVVHELPNLLIRQRLALWWCCGALQVLNPVSLKPFILPVYTQAKVCVVRVLQPINHALDRCHL